MQGKQIADGPLPFMFGATKEKLNARYWIREIKPPDDRKGEYWLDVFPRYPDDAVNFSRVLVILDEEQFLPVGLQIFSPNYDPRKNWARTTYHFTDRQVNNPIHRGRQFFDRFISPNPPLGWKKVVANYGQPAGQPPHATATKPQTAQPPRQNRSASIPLDEATRACHSEGAGTDALRRWPPLQDDISYFNTL